jgi:transposase-like protein
VRIFCPRKKDFLCPKGYPTEFQRNVVAIAWEQEAPLAQIAKDFSICEVTL